jgi:tetratricopeptide (TPR) repeat protein
MSELKAFVGHSFSEHDKILVGIFCEHFDNLAKAHLNFTWDHAVEAEPSPLSQKVLAKIEGKNVFIGICTRHELAVRDASLRPGIFRKSVLSGDADKFKWKASDWIIQEIGLAVGRNMSIVIFLEDGVREPGGLYGNIEYIPFSRANPQASFDKLLQMLLSLSPKEPTGSTADSETAAPEKNRRLAEAESPDLEPKADWTEDRYQSAMVTVVLRDDAIALERITDAFLASKHSTGFGAAEWDARIEWLRILFSKQGSFEKLKRLAEENPLSARLQMFLARAYDELGEHEKAAEIFQKASCAAEDQARRATYESDAAIQYARAGELSRAHSIFEGAKQLAKDQPSIQGAITDDLRTLAQIEKDDALELTALEHGVELNPTDWNLRFQLAYKHSQHDNGDMALFHYSKIPAPLRDSITWNNLGVSFADLSMHAKSVRAFRRAENLNDTLAMSNLGFRLARAGFVDEAGALAKKALGLESYHSNITDLLKRLKEIPEEEAKKETEALEKVKPKALFYRHLGDAVLAETPLEIGTKWQASETILNASIDGTEVRIWGEYEQEERNSVGGLLAGIVRRKVTVQIQYTLRLRGNLLIGEVRRTADNENSLSLLSLGVTSQKVAMYLQTGRTELRVMEGSSFYKLKCID